MTAGAQPDLFAGRAQRDGGRGSRRWTTARWPASTWRRPALFRAALGRRAGRAATATIRTRSIVAGGTDVGLWVTKQHAAPRRPSIAIGAVAELKRIAVEDGGRSDDRRRRQPIATRLAALARIHPDLGELMRRFASDPDPQRRDRRRQHRQRLADRRLAAGADRARRAADAAARRPSGARSRWRISSSPTASRTARRASSSSAVYVPAPDPGSIAALLQDLQALRPGHLGRAGRVRAARSTAARSRTSASPSAAWRRRPKRARQAEAALTGKPWTPRDCRARRWRAVGGLHADHRHARLAPRYRLQVAQNLLRRFFIETSEPAARTRIMAERRAAHARA